MSFPVLNILYCYHNLAVSSQVLIILERTAKASHTGDTITVHS